MGQLEAAISSGLWRSNVPDDKGTALWAIPAGRIGTGSGTTRANWWPAVSIHLVCTQRPHPACPWAQQSKQEFLFIHFSFNAGYKKISEPNSLLSKVTKVTYHCDVDHHLQNLASPSLSSDQDPHNTVPILPVLLPILKSMVTVGMETPGNRTVPCSHLFIFLWQQNSALFSLVHLPLVRRAIIADCFRLLVCPCHTRSHEYNATSPKG